MTNEQKEHHYFIGNSSHLYSSSFNLFHPKIHIRISMKTKTKILIVVVILALGGLTVWKWKQSDKAVIKINEINQATKEVDFEMSYKAMKFAGSMKHGGIRRQPLNGYTFEAITNGNTIIFSIISEEGDVLATKTITFNG